ncbi:putative glutamine amidotransferase-like protein [Rhizophagus clarus]|uniref:Putative glutamine amidotransferase-like protein n=1 Tax=Rhizophagus clarus TaxID=94130 RepID=A0A8H3KTU0_9GLOM|nr:putative glutamine amidotransferase-like protein [Rhizophagus clarus]
MSKLVLANINRIRTCGWISLNKTGNNRLEVFIDDGSRFSFSSSIIVHFWLLESYMTGARIESLKWIPSEQNPQKNKLAIKPYDVTKLEYPSEQELLDTDGIVITGSRLLEFVSDIRLLPEQGGGQVIKNPLGWEEILKTNRKTPSRSASSGQKCVEFLTGEIEPDVVDG